MAITAKLVKELRERTGAGMMECKKYLTETDGDIEVAIENMRKAGAAKAAKRAGRIAAEGVVVINMSDDAKQAVMIEINSETDFVARDENFNNFADCVSECALKQQAASLEELLALQCEGAVCGGNTIEQAREALVAKIGENINIRRVASLQAEGVLGQYRHGTRIGVLVDLVGGDEALAKDIAMHIAASQPSVVTPEQVDEALIAKEREIYTEQAKTSGKPDDIIAKMVEGRVQKYLKEVSLVGQPFVKDPSTTVGKLLDAAGAKVVRFERFAVGEGIEKAEENFAEEVMAQVRGSE